LPMLYQRLINEFVFPGSISLREAHSRGLNDAIEGLAVPLGLVELRAGSYIFIPDHENHPLLSTVFGLISSAGETKLPDVLHSLETGRFGVPEDTAYFLLAALAFGGLITGRLNLLKRVASLLNDRLPDLLRARIFLSQILVDSWSTKELRSIVNQRLQVVAEKGEEWLDMLSPVEPIVLEENPIVMILDGVSPDVWLETMAGLKCDIDETTLSWHRLETVPKTGPAISALFGFLDDAMDEFSSRDIPYHHLKGNEIHGLEDLLPPFAPDKPAVIRISLVDEGAHSALLRLAEMPVAVCRFFTTYPDNG